MRLIRFIVVATVLLLAPIAAQARSFCAGDTVSISDLAAGNINEYFKSSLIPDSIFSFMQGRSYPANCPVKRSQLRYLKLLHYNLQGQVQVGEMVVAADLATDVLSIFRQLFDHKYPIEKIMLVDNYDGDDNRSMADNNTSCFNYRTVSGGSTMSLHAKGRAIDINPLYNPFVVRRKSGKTRILPPEGVPYANRTKDFPCKITNNDLCYKIFAKKGWLWGGNFRTSKDYQHFYRR